MKHLHMTLALVSILLFCLRFAWLMKDHPNLSAKWVKITPHVVDTFLLLVGVAMMLKLGMTPMNQPWLAEKLLALVAYIFTGYFTLKLARNNVMRWFGFLGALGWFMLIARLAVSKQTILL